MASMPVLLFPDELGQQVVPFVLALIIGGVAISLNEPVNALARRRSSSVSGTSRDVV
jgi:hypothetical protein